MLLAFGCCRTDRWRLTDAITLAQADRLEDIYPHRHDLSHELIEYIVDPDFEPDVELFTDALTILKVIRRFRTSIEKEIGAFETWERTWRPSLTTGRRRW